MFGWACLYISIALEVGATTALRMSDGFEKLHFAALAVVLYIICFFFLAQVLKLLPVGVAYAIWGGVGTVLIAAIGVYYFGESIDATRGAFMALIIIGAVGLNLTSSTDERATTEPSQEVVEITSPPENE